ncbi:MAG TPA: hypothetical protein VHO47_04375 [Candidatus Babeliales bacterium]|nr:hypothetical protein [Candidatus Babeliales bacterium]
MKQFGWLFFFLISSLLNCMEKDFPINKNIWKHQIKCSDGITFLTMQELSRFQSLKPQAKIALPTISVLAINILSRPEASFPGIMYEIKKQKALTWDKLLHLYKAAEYLKVCDEKKQLCLELLKRKSYSVHNLLEIEKVSAQNRSITLENGTLTIKTGYLKTLEGIQALADKKISAYQKSVTRIIIWLLLMSKTNKISRRFRKPTE